MGYFAWCVSFIPVVLHWERNSFLDIATLLEGNTRKRLGTFFFPAANALHAREPSTRIVPRCEDLPALKRVSGGAARSTGSPSNNSYCSVQSAPKIPTEGGL